MPDFPGCYNTRSQRDDFDGLSDAMLDKSFSRVLNVPIAPFGKHAPD